MFAADPGGYDVVTCIGAPFAIGSFEEALMWMLERLKPGGVLAVGRGGGQGGLEVLGPVMKVLGAFMGLGPNFDTRPRGFLGFTCEERMGRVVVSGVLPGGPAAAAGLKAGDTLHRVEATPGKAREVSATAELDKHLAAVKPGDVVKLTVARTGGDNPTLTLTAGKGL